MGLSATRTGLLAEIDDGVDRATTWLLARLGDAPPADVVVPHAYRVPYTLALVGRRAEAASLLSWMEHAVLTPDGDLRPGPLRSAFATAWSSYPLALLAQAAWHLERYATAAAIVRTLHRFRDPVTGGAFAERPEQRRSTRQDLFPTAQLGLTGLTVGDAELATGAARWLAGLHEQQPDLPRRLYSATMGAELISAPADVAADPFGLCTDLHAPRQAFYNPGIAAAFLARYSARYADDAARRLAAAYLDLTVAGDPHQFEFTDSVQVCKFAWGAAALLDLGAPEPYRGYVERMGRWFLAAQHADGHWQNSPFLRPSGPAATGSDIEVTAEFVQHLVVCAAALAGAPR